VTCFTETMFLSTTSRVGNKVASLFCIDDDWPRAFPMKNENEAHEALSLLFHRDGVPNVTVLDGAKAQVQGNFRRKLSGVGCQIKETEHYPDNSNLGEAGGRELKRGVGWEMLHSGCPKCCWDDCLVNEAYVRSHAALAIF
jgi:hypothetical protein